MKFELPNGWVAEGKPMKMGPNGQLSEIDEKEIPEHVKQQMLSDILQITSNLNIKECQFCKETHDLRTVGPKGEEICFPCSILNPAAAYSAIRAEHGPDAAERYLQHAKEYQEGHKADLSKMN